MLRESGKREKLKHRSIQQYTLHPDVVNTLYQTGNAYV